MDNNSGIYSPFAKTSGVIKVRSPYNSMPNKPDWPEDPRFPANDSRNLRDKEMWLSRPGQGKNKQRRHAKDLLEKAICAECGISWKTVKETKLKEGHPKPPFFVVKFGDPVDSQVFLCPKDWHAQRRASLKAKEPTPHDVRQTLWDKEEEEEEEEQEGEEGEDDEEEKSSPHKLAHVSRSGRTLKPRQFSP